MSGMSLRGRVERWWYWRQMAKIDRECRKRGHDDFGCWAETGAIGDRCGRCGRILWTWDYGQELDPPRYQAPSRLVDSNWR